MNRPMTIRTQIQQESPHNPHKEHSCSIQLRTLRRLHHWLPQDSYHVRPPHKDRKSKQIYIIHGSNQKKGSSKGRQRNNLQTKEKEESPEKELNDVEASKLSVTDFKVMVIGILKELSENYISMKENIETMNKNQLEMKNETSDMKNTLGVITSRLGEAEN